MPTNKLKVISEKSKVKVKSSKAEPVVKVQPAKKTEGLNAQVMGLDGKVISSTTLPKEIFGEKINKNLMTQAVNIYLSNQREGSASTKGRGEVTGSTRKIYRQKGTGRARHGGITAPIFVGGGIAHGPHPHSFAKKFSQKMKQKALFSALSEKHKDGKMTVVGGLVQGPLKTKEMAKGLSALSLSDKSVLLVISKEMEKAKKSARNIKNVSVRLASQINTYEVLKNSQVVIAKEAIDAMVEHYFKGGQK